MGEYHRLYKGRGKERLGRNHRPGKAFLILYNDMTTKSEEGARGQQVNSCVSVLFILISFSRIYCNGTYTLNFVKKAVLCIRGK